MSIEDESTGLKSGFPGPEIPYSVSIPITLGIATSPRIRDDPGLCVGCFQRLKGETKQVPGGGPGHRRGLRQGRADLLRIGPKAEDPAGAEDHPARSGVVSNPQGAL